MPSSLRPWWICFGRPNSLSLPREMMTYCTSLWEPWSRPFRALRRRVQWRSERVEKKRRQGGKGTGRVIVDPIIFSLYWQEGIATATADFLILVIDLIYLSGFAVVLCRATVVLRGHFHKALTSEWPAWWPSGVTYTPYTTEIIRLGSAVAFCHYGAVPATCRWQTLNHYARLFFSLFIVVAAQTTLYNFFLRKYSNIKTKLSCVTMFVD